MSELIYPTIDVFIYDLGQVLLDSEEQIKARRKQFLQKIYQGEDLKNKFQELELVGNTSESLDYLQLLQEFFENNLDGYYYGLQIGDSYSLQINYSGIKKSEEEQTKPISLAEIASLKRVILEHIHSPQLDSETENTTSETKKGTLGETWLIWGQLANQQVSESEIAHNSCQELFSNAYINSRTASLKSELKFDLLSSGHLFEFWQTSAVPQDYHLLVWLFPHNLSLEQVKQNVESTYYDLTRLLLFRHKIILAYQESKILKRTLKQEYEFIYRQIISLEKNIQNSRYDLNYLRTQLTNNLKALSQYTDLLNRLNFQALTIKINLNNYQKRLNTIQKRDETNTLDNLTFFIDYVNEKYQQDIDASYAYFSSGTLLLEQTIQTVEGLINLAQTQSDRHFTELVAFASSGLGAGAIALSLVTAQIPPGVEPKSFFFHNLAVTCLVVIFGGLCGYLFWKLYLWFSNFWQKTIN